MKSFRSENIKCQNCLKVLKIDFSDMFVIKSNHNDCLQGHKFQNCKPAMLKTITLCVGMNVQSCTKFFSIIELDFSCKMLLKSG